MLNKRAATSKQRGDTIIEVLLAVAVLGVLIMIGYNVMSRGMAAGYNSLDRTNTQAIMNGQAALLRAALASDTVASGDAWSLILLKVKPSLSANPQSDLYLTDKRGDGCDTDQGIATADYERLFYLDVDSTDGSVRVNNYLPSPGVNPQKAQLVRTGSSPALGAGNGVWIEGYKDTGVDENGNPIYITNSYVFYVKACNQPVYSDGSDVLRQSVTIVRLYDSP